ncbi:bifunctional RNase H/acid phosphatase [Corynebacterium bovis]|uniref:bifunctional RNase H/acid phosphatase n=1 Tax=Corynebacterium bovis TaxID=36808 RepID=UPI00244B4635|nr:bifunctional RNase H/acid phosphatase [Corynebacterium bovis]MDH2456011.1 bifunctional RNase H/acid phosphatase [Corynebacterium bovis]
MTAGGQQQGTTGRVPAEVAVECDGGSRGNPGTAGAGSLVLTADRRTVLATCHEYIPRATNNVAEYTGLVNALTLARDLGARRVHVHMDSKLVVEQMSGRWKIKHPDMKPLAATVKALEKDFDAVDYTWVPRADNARADALANQAMDTKASGEERPSGGGSASRDAAPSWMGDCDRPTRLLLLRHGQTELSAEGRFSGLSDPALTATGRDQARRAAAYLASRGGIDAVVTSPLRRTRETAAACVASLGLDEAAVTTDRGVVELDFGEWEGRTFAEVHERWADEHTAWMTDPTVPAVGGESLSDVDDRVAAAVDGIVERNPGRTVLVVSHVTPIKATVRRALGASADIYRTLHLDLASLSVVEFYPDGRSVVRLVNDTHYLR